MHRRDLRLLAALSVGLLSFAACGGGDDADDDGADPGSGGGDTLTVSIQDFSFSPNELSVESLADVTIEVTNEGDTTHTFTASGGDFDESLDPGGSATVTFTAPDAGELEFHCKIHPDMTGTISIGAGDSSGGGGSEGDKDSTSLDY